MYKGASQNSQARMGRGTFRDAQGVSGRDEKIGDAERERIFKSALSDIENQILRHPPGTAARKLLAARKTALQAERTAYLKIKNRSAHNTDYMRVHFIFHQLVQTRIGTGAFFDLMQEAKADYAAERGLTIEEAFNKDRSDR